jgi:hypothetical protein
MKTLARSVALAAAASLCSTVGATLALTLSGCGDSASPVDLAPPDMATFYDLTGPRSGVGDPCQLTRGEKGTCSGDNAICLGGGQFGMPGGYCSQDCSKTACPDDAQCAELAPGFSLCLAACNVDADCRSPDYHCTAYQTCEPLGGIYLGSEVEPGKKDGAACVTPAVDPPNGLSFEPNQQLSTITGGETDVAVDEAGGNVVVAWIQLYGNQAIGVMASHDLGLSWDPPQFLPANNRVDSANAQSDPVTAVDSQGNFFVAWIGFDGFTGERLNAYVARSTDGGATFPDVFLVSPRDEWRTGDFLDKPWMAVGPDDSIYVSWAANARADGAPVMRIARSVDHGQTWSAPTTATPDDSVFHNLCEVAVGPDGSVYTVAVELNGNQLGDPTNNIAFQRLTADLNIDGPSRVVSVPGDSPPFDEPSIAVDGDNVYIAYVSGTPLGAWDLFVTASTDRGTTFQPPVRVNDDATCATHMHPAITVDGSGRPHVIFYDNRYGTAALMHSVASASAAVGTLSFGANEFVNDAPFTFVTERDTPDWLGDYPGITARGAHTYVSWTDNRVNDTAQIFFTRSGF